ncbi:MAG: hypothetical protein ACSHWW_00690 [Nonlabens sp.]|uniref:hypothetical protein n=1 Tax=Nonlabens sp. TaxID=1888209 RepID=UPI003EF492A4
MRAFQFTVICFVLLLSCKSELKTEVSIVDECEFWVNLNDEFEEGQHGYSNYLKSKLPEIIKDYKNHKTENNRSINRYDENLATYISFSHRRQRDTKSPKDSLVQQFYHLSKRHLGEQQIVLNEDKFYEVITSDIVEEKWMAFFEIDSIVRKKALPYIKEHGLPVKEDSLCKEAYKSVLYRFAQDKELQSILQEMKDNNQITKDDLSLANANLLN